MLDFNALVVWLQLAMYLSTHGEAVKNLKGQEKHSKPWTRSCSSILWRNHILCQRGLFCWVSASPQHLFKCYRGMGGGVAGQTCFTSEIWNNVTITRWQRSHPGHFGFTFVKQKRGTGDTSSIFICQAPLTNQSSLKGFYFPWTRSS